MTTLRDALKDGGSRSLGSDSGQIAVSYLRFFDSNARESYGFNPEYESVILELIKEKYLDFSFNDPDREFILSNLVDPDIASDPKSPHYKHSMAWLANSIIAEGVQTPIRGYWDSNSNQFFNTDGNRRLAALIVARLLGTEVKTVPILVEAEKPTSAHAEASYLKRQFLANTGKPLSPLEELKLIKQLLKLGTPEEELISLVGSKAILEQRLKLGEMTYEMQNMIAKGEVTPTAAIEVVKEGLENGLNHSEITEAAQEAVAEVKSQAKNGKTKAKKASTRQIKEKVATKAKASGIGFKSVKPDDPVKVQGLKQNILYAIQKESALDKLSYADLKELFQILNK